MIPGILSSRAAVNTEKRRFGYWKIRQFLDKLASLVISFGGVSVILSIILIGVFLFYMVAPMFAPASFDKGERYAFPFNIDERLIVGTDDYLDSAYSFDSQGLFNVFNAKDGKKKVEPQAFANGSIVTAKSAVIQSNDSYVFGLDNGRFIVRQVEFSLSYPDDVRQVTTTLQSPLGEQDIETGLAEEPVTNIALVTESGLAMAAMYQPSSGLHLNKYRIRTSLLTGESEVKLEDNQQLPGIDEQPLWLGIDQLMEWLYVLTAEELKVFRLDNDTAVAVQGITFADELGKATTATFLLGNLSLLIGFDSGKIVQAFPVPSEGNGQNNIAIIREFPALQGMVTSISTEHIRRGFAASDNKGNINLYYSTNKALAGKIALNTAIQKVVVGPRHDALIVLDEHNDSHIFYLDNHHPEVSFTSLWSKIWYEFYPEPDYIWQSSSASSDFEPKFSMAPLAFGTLKAAFYAMLIAIPLAIMGAIYTAFFLSSRLRQAIKPVIELMEALPTVILGFLAGLWLAPFIENNLTFLFAFLVLIIPCTILFGFVVYLLENKSNKMPDFLSALFSEEWRVILLIPLLIIFISCIFIVQSPLEQVVFGGDIQNFITESLGLGFDQRNAIIIGIAMGFAVIPTIFSITEDAIFSVPQQLVSGSLALGASRWQTLVGVVLPTASAGIFSAVMIGMGRAVGETMIVLMATGNTPVMNWNIFEGLRTLSANIAVEMPESEVGSSHYRVLFLAGLVLFAFTFIVNTIAEIVRQNLRKKYGSL